jgi:hypothetical protein
LRFAVPTAGKPQSKHRRREGPDRPGTPPQTSHFRSPSRSPAALVCGPAHPPLTLSHPQPMMTEALCASVIIVPRPLARADGTTTIPILLRARSSTPTAYHTPFICAPASSSLRLSHCDPLTAFHTAPLALHLWPSALTSSILAPALQPPTEMATRTAYLTPSQRPAPSLRTVEGASHERFRRRVQITKTSNRMEMAVYTQSMSRNGLRTRPPGVDPRAAGGDGRRIPSRMRVGPTVRATFWNSKLSTLRCHLHPGSVF